MANPIGARRRIDMRLRCLSARCRAKLNLPELSFAELGAPLGEISMMVIVADASALKCSRHFCQTISASHPSLFEFASACSVSCAQSCVAKRATKS